ncbi:MAG TPA: hypothetical protein VID27_13910 [Blastocatellia bacterium]|jgi:hypothetical protein
MQSAEIAAIDTPEGHQKFLRERWKNFAAFAWKKYRTEGRGAVVINLRRASLEGSKLKVPTFFVAEAGEGLRARGGWPDAEIARAVEDYDPREEIVFIFLRLNGDIFHYVAMDDPAPVDCEGK